MVNQRIPYGRQNISEEDIKAVVDVLRSSHLTQGPSIEAFEKAVAQRCGVKHAIAVCNATAALHISCLALDLRPGQELVTSPNSFVASANCGLYCGARVGFVDIDSRTWNMDINALERRLASGSIPQVVVPVHFAGQSVDMDHLGALKRRYGFAVIEDASHAIGATYQGRPVGFCDNSDITVFSLHPVKVMTSGEGGLILTNRDDVAARVKRLRSHGITRDQALMPGPSHGPWYYAQTELGFNYRMTDLQAALGLSQLHRLDEFTSRRRQLVHQYHQLLESLPVVRPWEQNGNQSAHHLYVIRIQHHLLDPSRTKNQVFQSMLELGIEVNLHYMPIYWQPYYEQQGHKKGQCPQAEAYYQEAMTLPLYYDLTDDQQRRVVESLRQSLGL